MQLVSRSNREIKGTQYKLNINPIYWLKRKESGDWGTSQQSKSSTRFDSLTQYKVGYTEQKWDQPRYPLLMFAAPSRSYVMPLVKCSSRTVKSKDMLNQCYFQCNASSNTNQWHFFTCPAKFPIKISCFFSLEMQMSWSTYSPVPKYQLCSSC